MFVFKCMLRFEGADEARGPVIYWTRTQRSSVPQPGSKIRFGAGDAVLWPKVRKVDTEARTIDFSPEGIREEQLVATGWNRLEA